MTGMVRTGVGRYLPLLVSSLILISLLMAYSIAMAYALLIAAPRMAPAVERALGGGRPPAAELQYPAGWWQRHNNEADGYTLALPPGWQVLSLGDVPAPAVADDQESEPPVEERLASLRRKRAAGGVGVWVAVAPDEVLGNATTVNIVRQPLDREMPVAEFARANLDALQESGNLAGPIKQRWLDLTSGRALRTRVTYRVPGEDGDTLLCIVQVFLVRGDDGYVLTGVTRPEQADGYAPVLDGIARSLRWTT
jgi:hypothetical protein